MKEKPAAKTDFLRLEETRIVPKRRTSTAPAQGLMALAAAAPIKAGSVSLVLNFSPRTSPGLSSRSERESRTIFSGGLSGHEKFLIGDMGRRGSFPPSVARK